MSGLSEIRWRVLVLGLASALAGTSPAEAQARRNIEVLGRDEGSRVALVIGNGGYPTGPLRNPVNDARDVADALEQTGFTVHRFFELDNRAMKEAVRAFADELRGAEVGLFYYAGHGVQVEGRNYLIPVDADIRRETDVEFESLDVGFVLAEMEAAGNPLNILILDACRNNPFARSFRSAQQGLASIDAPAGTLIAYATAPGSVASDGPGNNGLYTQELLRHLRTPGLAVEGLFKRVRVAVMQLSGHEQTPWESSSLTGEFSFVPDGGRVADSTSPADASRPPVSGTTGGGVGAADAAGVGSILVEAYDRYLERGPRSGMQILERALQAHPDHPELLLALGNYAFAVAAEEGPRDDSTASPPRVQALYRTAVDAHMKVFNARGAVGGAQQFRNAVIAQMRLGEDRAALAFADRLLAQDPDETLIMSARADVLWRLGRVDEAVAALNAVLDLDPRHPNARARQGQWLLEADRVQAGLAKVRAAVAAGEQPADAMSQVLLAKAYQDYIQNQKDYAKAAEVLEGAFDLGLSDEAEQKINFWSAFSLYSLGIEVQEPQTVESAREALSLFQKALERFRGSRQYAETQPSIRLDQYLSNTRTYIEIQEAVIRRGRSLSGCA